MEWLGIKCTVNTVKSKTNYVLWFITLTIREDNSVRSGDFNASVGFLSV